mgnify:CR=1 FL=1
MSEMRVVMTTTSKAASAVCGRAHKDDTAAICAVLAILPLTRQRRPSGPLNVLFFGSFTQLSEEEFTNQIVSKLQSDDSILKPMMKTAADKYAAEKKIERRTPADCQS